MDKNQEEVSWTNDNEVVKSNKALLLLLKLFKFQPSWLVHLLIYPVAFFYWIFSKRGRDMSLNYQRNLSEYTNKEAPKKISAYRQILSFCLCVLEKMEGWLGKINLNQLEYQDDDVKALISQLNEGKGAILFGAHMGNLELLRALASYDRTNVDHPIQVIIIMQKNATQQFAKTIQEINPKFELNAVDPEEITPETIERFSDLIDNGGLLVLTGDRLSANSNSKTITTNFLGKPAKLPYGVFLIAALLKAPVYYTFAMRKRLTAFNPINRMYVTKSQISFEDCPRGERENRIKLFADEFVTQIEQKCKEYPYQWYNFYNFWISN